MTSLPLPTTELDKLSLLENSLKLSPVLLLCKQRKIQNFRRYKSCKKNVQFVKFPGSSSLFIKKRVCIKSIRQHLDRCEFSSDFPFENSLCKLIFGLLIDVRFANYYPNKLGRSYTTKKIPFCITQIQLRSQMTSTILCSIDFLDLMYASS